MNNIVKMNNRHIIYVPGKNPKPEAIQHRSLLWRALLEGVRRADPGIFADLQPHENNFSLIAWNYIYYKQSKDVSRDLPWIDALVNIHGPSPEDIQEANRRHNKLDLTLFNLADLFSPLIWILPKPARKTVEETRRYFHNDGDIACDIRQLLKQVLRPLLANGDQVLLIGHSLGSVIAYDTLWELSHLEKLKHKISLFLTLGSPLGMNYVQRQLTGNNGNGKTRYPTNIQHWTNIAAEGDMVSLDRILHARYHPMLEQGIVETIEDHCTGIYNFFHDENGLNPHRSYGYLVNPAVGKVIADWWHTTQPEQSH